ncbi:MAG: glycosyltransferase [Chloroflexi bacterium]|nr:glycosyltransferase [Chloroflexota bacterium]
MISIIIPTYNRSDDLKQALTSILRQGCTDYEVLVVDNGPSTDGTREAVASLGDARLRYLATKMKGQLLACNTGAAAARGDILLMLDDDVELISGTELAELAETFRLDENIAIAGGMELRSRDEVVGKSVQLPPGTGRISARGDFNTAFKLIEGHGITEVDHVRTAFMGVRGEVFRRVGGFDGAVYDLKSWCFRYESDLCLRVKQAGHKVVVNPAIKVWHKAAARPGGPERGRGARYFFYANRNHVFFMNRFFWRGNPASLLRDIAWGSFRTPGIGLCLLRAWQQKKASFLSYAFISAAGKIEGYRRYLIEPEQSSNSR